MHRTLNKRIAYGALILSICFEQAGTAMLEAAAQTGFHRPLPLIGTAVCLSACYLLFSKVLESINLSISYATWSAVGTIGAALMGLWLFGQQLSIWGWIGIFVMCVGIVLLNLYGAPAKSRNPSASENAPRADADPVSAAFDQSKSDREVLS